MILKVKKLSENAILPTMAHSTDSGFDVYSIENKVLFSNFPQKIKIGLAFELPANTELQVRPKSGLSSKGCIVVLGTVDEGYRGEVEVIIFNLSNVPLSIKAGQKIAQLVLMPVLRPVLEVIEEIDTETDRGVNGFGSTGV